MKSLFLMIVLLTASVASASNVDLSTVPKRDSVQLTIYNSEDLTLVRETRKLTFKKGVNPIQFSWANTLIDSTSVQLKFASSAEKLEVLDTTFPHDKPQMLYWNVQSDFDGEATVEITYFTSGITWSADYLAIADKDETKINLQNFVRVTNHSGEDYDDAQVRLVVGTINLVEKIAQLARVPMDQVDKLEKDDRASLRNQAVTLSFAAGATAAAPSSAKPKEIIKEGLSEYFIYTIEGTETIPNGWSKRLRSLEANDVPLKIQYRYRPQEYGDRLGGMYLLINDKPSKLGTTPMPDGVVRMFRDNGRDGLSFLTSQSIKYVPIGDKIELNLGMDPEVIFELKKLRSIRDNIWMHWDGTDVYRRADDGAVKIDVRSTVAGWDERELFDQRIRNYSGKAIDVEIRRSFDGHFVFRSQLNPVLFDYRTVQLSATVEPGKTSDLLFEALHHRGRNAKQNNVTLETADAKAMLEPNQ